MPTSTYVIRGAQSEAGEIFNGAIAGANAQSVDILVKDYDFITVWWQLLSTVTLADMLAYISFYKADQVGLMANGFPPVRNTGVVSDGTNIHQLSQYDIRGLEKIRVNLSNNNAGSKNAILTVFFAKD